MRVLVACEESQAVTKELRRLGHEAYSCDIIECSGGHPEWHIKEDVLPLLKPDWIHLWSDEPAALGFEFVTEDGRLHFVPGKWDMIIAFPPCTHLAVSGARHFEKKRADGRQREGIEFFCQFLNADCDRIAVENPVGIIGGDYIQNFFPDLAEKYGLPRKPSQIVQPYEYGHPNKKTTCLWLKGLPKLVPTEIISPEPDFVSPNGKKYPNWMMETLKNCKTPEERSTARSKTFPGIAKAMAEQWGGVTMRQKLIELISQAQDNGIMQGNHVTHMAHISNQTIADHLIANGVVVLQ